MQLAKQREKSNTQRTNSQRTNSQSSARSGGGGIQRITVTQHVNDNYEEPKPETPSRSSQRNDCSETQEDETDYEILQRDKDYRPSIVENLGLYIF